MIWEKVGQRYKWEILWKITLVTFMIKEELEGKWFGQMACSANEFKFSKCNLRDTADY